MSSSSLETFRFKSLIKVPTRGLASPCTTQVPGGIELLIANDLLRAARYPKVLGMDAGTTPRRGHVKRSMGEVGVQKGPPRVFAGQYVAK